MKNAPSKAKQSKYNVKKTNVNMEKPYFMSQVVEAYRPKRK